MTKYKTNNTNAAIAAMPVAVVFVLLPAWPVPANMAQTKSSESSASTDFLGG